MTESRGRSISIPDDLVAKIEAWAATQQEPPDLPKASLQLIERALKPRRKRDLSEVDLQWQAMVPRLFLDRAREFFVSYKQLPRQSVMDWARYSLLCHSMELALNCYLIHLGAKPSEVQDQFSHRLGDLLRACKAKGLMIDDADVAWLANVDIVHRNFWPRYPKPEAHTIPAADNFDDAQVRLLNAVSIAVDHVPMFQDQT